MHSLRIGLYILFFAGTFSLLLVGCNNESSVQEGSSLDELDPVLTQEIDYASYDALLSSYVDDNGMVNYSELQKNREGLDTFVEALSNVDPKALEVWEEDAQLALWINAYNAITLQRILDHYPIKRGISVAAIAFPKNSIRQIPGVWTETESLVAGQSLTLDDIEHEIMRKDFDEPRIHVAIVCASISCPPLRSEAFHPDRLGEQLADQARSFLANTANFRIDSKKNRIYLSEIFDWFGEDYLSNYTPSGGYSGHNPTERAVLHFVSQYVSEEMAQTIREDDYSIRYADYDWSLNEQ